MEPNSYKFSDHVEGASSTDMEAEAEADAKFMASHDFGTTQRRKRRYIILGIVTLCVVGAAVGGGIAASSSEKGSSPGSAPATPFPTSQNAGEIKDAILTVARKGGAEFDSPYSYQSKALAYVQGQSLPAPQIPLSLEKQSIQLYALACIYYNTFSVRSAWTVFKYGEDITIPGWYTAKGWLGDSNDLCTNWWGITCNNDGQVEKLELNENGLTGYLPPETALLHDSLKVIDLFDNLIHNKGDLGHSFLGELTNLEFLYYGKTMFENDGIPSAIAKLTKLQEYDCSNTIYTGPLQGSTFAPLIFLDYLSIAGNEFNGALPEELFTLPELKFLYAGFTNIEGDLEFVHRMPKIRELHLDDNPGMKGTIPTTIGLATTLASFAVTNCELSGPLPTELGVMLEMELLWLYDNHLTGDIPTELNNLYNLKILHLQKNDLLGQVPAGVCSKFKPFGKLEEIEADCDNDGGTTEVTCTCCTCCGEGCIDYEVRTRRSL